MAQSSSTVGQPLVGAEGSGATPRYIGLGYVAFGAALLFAPRPSKAMAIATGVFGTALLANAVGIWRASNSLEASKALAGNAPRSSQRSPLGESLPEALARTKGAITSKKFFPAPTLEARIDQIRKLARDGAVDPDIRSRALAVLTRTCGTGPDRKWKVPEKDWEGEVKALFEAYRDPRSGIGVRYVCDPLPMDTYTAAKKTQQLQGGDCDDGAITMGAMLMSVGYPIKFRVIQAKGSASWSHIYLLAGVPPGGKNVKKWIPIDVTMNKPVGWEAPSSMVVARRDFDG